MGSPFTDQEILQAFNDIADNKTLDIDGFTIKFFMAIWDIIGRKFLLVVKHFSLTSKMPYIFKHTLITLILKSKNATYMEDYKPISLCITFYKVVAKVLENRLEKVLPMIINQS